MPESAAQRIIANQFDVLSFSGRVTNLLWDALATARDDLLRNIEAGQPTTPFSATRQQIFLAQVDAALLRANEQYGRELEPALRATIIHEYEATTKALLADAGKKLPDPFPILPLERVQQLASKPIGGKTLQPWLDKHFKGLRTQLRLEVAQSVLLGEDLRTAGNRLKHAFGLTRHGAETLAHTALLSTAHEARKAVYKENASLIKSYRYLATLDRRTCPLCQPWDGQEAETVGAFPNLPQHPRCRCVIIPVTSLSRVGTRPAVLETKSRVVHHRDGTTSTIHVPTKVAHVSSTTTYEQFFKRQPAEWQRSVLGPARYKMWKEGKVDPEDFTRGPKDARKIVPLDELRAKLKREGK